MSYAFLPRELPQGLENLTELALDMRWTWSHAGDSFWSKLEPNIWNATKNPWVILQDVSRQRLEELSNSPEFLEELKKLNQERENHLISTNWYQEAHTDADLSRIAYFSMEFGLGEALPLYAGGLGILAGDYLKAASDLGIPLVGVGLLYQEGYFRQSVDADGWQHATYPFNDPITLPIQPVSSPQGGWLHVRLDLPGRTLLLRVWHVTVGRISLYLLDSNDPRNSPSDRGITGKLYGGDQETRLMQEIVLGVGGWRALEMMDIQPEVCHLNEGHAAFVILERARSFMGKNKVSFHEALWATRAGNIFTTHTPVAAGFDRFTPALIEKYFPYFREYIARLGISPAELLGLGRQNPEDMSEPFNMAYLAMRGCSITNGVSRLHGEVSRQIFSPLYPRWPEEEIPVSHVTNGVHVPSWDSVWADQVWTEACGKERWMGTNETLSDAISCISDERLWSLRGSARHDLVDYARKRHGRQLGQRGADAAAIEEASRILDPNILTLGFARRFAEYKRPNLLLQDPARLTRILTNPERPVQLVVAGKAHPADDIGKHLVKSWIDFCSHPDVRNHVLFLEDYDVLLAQELVQGVDLWINTPRRPWEACGTSGMKVLVNGGLNLSELDGWWAEAYSPDSGWALGDGKEHNSDPAWDRYEAGQLYEILEKEVVPLFYDRNAQGIPEGWVSRIHASMAKLAPQFSSNRMAQEYVEKLYLPACAGFKQRSADNGERAKKLHAWSTRLKQGWNNVHFGQIVVHKEGNNWIFTIQAYLGDIEPEMVRAELIADPREGMDMERIVMTLGDAIPGTVNGYYYSGVVPATRPCEDFTARIIGYHSDAQIPIEAPFIHWQK